MKFALNTIVAIFFSIGIFSSFNNYQCCTARIGTQQEEQLSPDTGFVSEGIKNEVTSYTFRLPTPDVSKKSNFLLQCASSKKLNAFFSMDLFDRGGGGILSIPCYIHQHRLVV